MKDRIRLLPERVANQIAAGEVVNRPASVVKEMMENAIDAGATEVIVNTRRGGQDLIQIVDNGEGMSPNDARMAFERHATSKIESADDIYSLRTFGFRGEALASIGAVAQVELLTKYKDANIGTKTIINGGEFIEQQPAVCEQGTQFMVRNLFYNLPARRVFLEREGSRAMHVKDEFRRIAICNPNIAFELYADDMPIYKLPPATLASRIVDVVGRNMKSNLLEVHADTLIVKISGYIGKPDATKRSNDPYLFVNGRFFRSAYLNKAILKAYEKLVEVGAFPAYFIFLEVEPDRVDVNVHPQKTEVQFADESSIWQILNAAVREALARTGVIPMMEFDNESSIDIPVMKQGRSYAEPKANNNTNYNPFDLEYTPPVDASRFNDEFVVEYEDYESGEGESSMRVADVMGSDVMGSNGMVERDDYEEVILEYEDIEIEPKPSDLLQSTKSEVESIEVGDIAMINSPYAWCKMGANMAVIHLKRAKERLLYDHYIENYKSGESVSQQILFPIELKLSTKEYELMNEAATDFAILGFDVEYCAEETVKVKGLPADVTPESADTLIYDLLQVLTTPLKIEEEMRDRVARVMARQSANALGRNISNAQAKDIVEQIAKSGRMGHTPSGKLIAWQVTREQIKEMLG